MRHPVTSRAISDRRHDDAKRRLPQNGGESFSSCPTASTKTPASTVTGVRLRRQNRRHPRRGRLAFADRLHREVRGAPSAAASTYPEAKTLQILERRRLREVVDAAHKRSAWKSGNLATSRWSCNRPAAVRVRVAHYPPAEHRSGTIEHRLFLEIQPDGRADRSISYEASSNTCAPRREAGSEGLRGARPPGADEPTRPGYKVYRRPNASERITREVRAMPKGTTRGRKSHAGMRNLGGRPLPREVCAVSGSPGLSGSARPVTAAQKSAEGIVCARQRTGQEG